MSQVFAVPDPTAGRGVGPFEAGELDLCSSPLSLRAKDAIPASPAVPSWIAPLPKSLGSRPTLTTPLDVNAARRLAAEEATNAPGCGCPVSCLD
jgi:hypothetical protein